MIHWFFNAGIGMEDAFYLHKFITMHDDALAPVVARSSSNMLW